MSKKPASRRQHEEGLAAFIATTRRSRFRGSLDDPRRRQTLRLELAHFQGRLDPRFAHLHEPHSKHEEHVEEVRALLAKGGAPETCFVVCDGDLDGQQLPLGQAVEDLMYAGSGFISCIPGQLGLYVSEDGSDVYVLGRRP